LGCYLFLVHGSSLGQWVTVRTARPCTYAVTKCWVRESVIRAGPQGGLRQIVPECIARNKRCSYWLVTHLFRDRHRERRGMRHTRQTVSHKSDGKGHRRPHSVTSGNYKVGMSRFDNGDEGEGYSRPREGYPRTIVAA